MKKLRQTIFFLMVLSAGMFSCAKQYKCTCNGIDNLYENKFSKSEADQEKAKCEANDGCVFSQK